jgi:hypothetical protein
MSEPLSSSVAVREPELPVLKNVAKGVVGLLAEDQDADHDEENVYVYL